MNFGEVRKAQLAKSTLLAGAPGIFSDLLGLLRCYRESGVRKATGNYRIYFIPSKTADLVHEFAWKTYLWAELQPWYLILQ